MRYAAILILALMAMPLSAQTDPEPPDPSAEKESFVIQPGSIDAGASSVALRFVSNDAAGFSNSSSKPPSVKFSAGVTLVPGTFQILNQNEAQCTVDVDDDAVGTIEVSIELFSVNGSTTLNTLRATLGIKGQTEVSGSQAQVGAESVRLVQVNVQAPQDAGVIVISGEITGTVQITAPTGTTFSEGPVVTTTSGDINTPALQTANTVFSFGIGNSSLSNVTVRVTAIKYNTTVFGIAGGVEGDLACEITGGALSNQVALVVNAFTAKTSIEGSNDVVEETPQSPGSEGSESTNETAPTGTGNVNTGDRNTRSLEDRNNNRNSRENRDGGSTSPVTSNPARPRGTSGPNNPPPPPNYGNSGGSPAPAVNPGGSGGVSKVGGGASSGAGMAGTGSVTKEEATDRETDEGSGKLEEKPKVLEISPGLHFCNADFEPLAAVVLDKQVADEAGGRVWIVLKLEKNKDRNKVETVTVKLTVNGTTRELILTETGENTGEFRCSKEGVLLVANENPDSNRENTAKKPPKPRVYK